jgi:hypothetical protein
MESLNTALLRIITRYIAGALVMLGLSPESTALIVGNPEFQSLILAGIGAALAAATEFVYAQARKDGKAL